MHSSQQKSVARRWLAIICTLVLAAMTASIPIASMTAATGEPADAVMDWNVNATTAIVPSPSSHRPGPS